MCTAVPIVRDVVREIDEREDGVRRRSHTLSSNTTQEWTLSAKRLTLFGPPAPDSRLGFPGIPVNNDNNRRATTATDATPCTSTMSATATSKKVYIGNLHWSLDDDAFRALLASAGGIVVSAKVAVPPRRPQGMSQHLQLP